jgi:hypothetical protein
MSAALDPAPLGADHPEAGFPKAVFPEAVFPDVFAR